MKLHKTRKEINLSAVFILINANFSCRTIALKVYAKPNILWTRFVQKGNAKETTTAVWEFYYLEQDIKELYTVIND